MMYSVPLQVDQMFSYTITNKQWQLYFLWQTPHPLPFVNACMHQCQHVYDHKMQNLKACLRTCTQTHLMNSFILKQCLESIRQTLNFVQRLWLINLNTRFAFLSHLPLSSRCSFLLCSWTEQECTRVFPMAGWLWYIYRPRHSYQQFPSKPSADNMFKVGSL